MEATFVNKEMFQYQKQAYWEGCLWSKTAGKVNNIKAIKLYSGASYAPGIGTRCPVRTGSVTDFSSLWQRCSTGVAQVAECLSSLWGSKYLCFQVPHMGAVPAKQETEEQKLWSKEGTKNWIGFSTLFQSQWTHTLQTGTQGQIVTPATVIFVQCYIHDRFVGLFKQNKPPCERTILCCLRFWDVPVREAIFAFRTWAKHHGLNNETLYSLEQL